MSLSCARSLRVCVHVRMCVCMFRSLQLPVRQANPPRMYTPNTANTQPGEQSLSLAQVLENYLSVIQATITRHQQTQAPEVGGNEQTSSIGSDGQEPYLYAGPQCDVCRIFIPLICENTFQFDTTNTHVDTSNNGSLLTRFLLTVKQLIRDKRVCVLVSVRPSMLDPSACECARSLFNVCDSVLAVESFAGRSEEIAAEFKVCISCVCMCCCVFF
jgi:hypothetical protein